MTTPPENQPWSARHNRPVPETDEPRPHDPTQEIPTGATTPLPVTEPAPSTPPAHATSTPPARATAAPRARRGPGWAGALTMAVASATVAGLLGGYTGGWLEDQDDDAGTTSVSVASGRPSGAGSSTAGSVARIADEVVPSVVTIRASGSGEQGVGSGFVLDRQGHVVTNNHVVAAAADGGRVTVQTSKGEQLDAKVVGRDASYDLAVLEVDPEGLQPVTMGRSSDVVVGDEVVAVGAPLGLSGSVTSGIVSALDRPVTAGRDDDRSYLNAIQTDAAINPGNSGGPLLDMDGRVIGVNSAIAQLPTASGGQGGSIGLGFAIPSDQVVRIADELIRTGRAVHPVIGVQLDLQYSGEGVRVLDRPEAVEASGPAAKAGIEPGDVITAFEGRPVSSPDALVVLIRSRKVGETVALTIRRGGAEKDVKMTLEASGD